MNEYGISAEWLQRLAGSLLHFVWQGALLAFVASILLHLLANRSAALRYTVAVVLFGLMLLAPCVTVFLYPETGAAASRVIQVFGESFRRPGSLPGAENAAQWTWWIVVAWAAGVSACSIRLIAGWVLSLRLIRSAQSAVPPALNRLMERAQSAVLAKGKAARLLIGERVTGPVVFGWLRPVVLLPASAVTGLNEAQLLAVLAHELAHVRRYDFLVNTMQRFVESLLFYHPAVWWLSARIRAERELCCDDMAISVCGDRFAYAEALLELERTRQATPVLAVPATGGLTARIRRLLGAEHINRDWQPATVALLILFTCVAFGMWKGETTAMAASTAKPAISPVAVAPAESAAPAPAATPSSLEAAAGAIAAIATAQTPQTISAGERWITTWGTAFVYGGTNTGVLGPTNGVECCNDQTVRMVMRVSVGGSSVRLRLSNANGYSPLFLGQVRVALHDRGSEIVARSDRQLSFGGRPSVEIPVGETITSDPVRLDVPAMADVVVSIYVPNETGPVTGALGPRSGYVVSGDLAGYSSLKGARLSAGRYWVSGIEVLRPDNAGVVVVVGNPNAFKERETSSPNQGWPSLLDARLQANNDTKNVSVIVTSDTERLLDPTRPGNFDAIVASQTGVRKLILCTDIATLPKDYLVLPVEGYQDISPADRMIKMFKRVIDLAGSRGIPVIGCTLPPSGGQDRLEAIRLAINAWMRSSGAFDHLIDVDAITRDPARMEKMMPELTVGGTAYSSNIFNDRGHKAVADAMDLSWFVGK
jgi:beta-lactamase regulating signal transducer with metallopeptidase domain